MIIQKKKKKKNSKTMAHSRLNSKIFEFYQQHHPQMFQTLSSLHIIINNIILIVNQTIMKQNQSYLS